MVLEETCLVTAPHHGHADGYRPPAVTGLHDLIDAQAGRRPRARALLVGADRAPVSYGTLAALAGELALQLRAEGLRPGRPVGLVSGNNLEFVVALLGAARAGLVVAPLDPTLPEPERQACYTALGVQAVLTGPPAAIQRPASPEVPAATLGGPAYWPLTVARGNDGQYAVTLAAGAAPLPGGAAHGAATELTGEDALALFTAGTTGRAKTVPLTHTNVAASVRSIAACYRLTPEDATVAAMPFFHGHGLLAGLLTTLASGGCVLLPERGRFTAHTFWDDMRAASATWYTAVPTIHDILLQRAPQEYCGSRVLPLRFARSCSAPLAPATARALEHLLDAPVLSAYGMTESTHQAASEPLSAPPGRTPGSVGRPAPVRVRVLDAAQRPCAPGTEGEIWVQGPTVARGYLTDPEATAAAFHDGWFRTGDLGRLDPEGRLLLTGRLKNLINRGGEKISPELVEEVLTAFPGVTEAAVFAVPDPLYGQCVGAAVVLGRGSTSTDYDLLAHCRSRLAPYEVPDRLAIVLSLPHTAKGTLNRRAVADLYGSR
ncbi:FadD7 family fatty acid--CoA ligase [Streptomyces sp. NPDC004629]|uniref:FadD7 family fatty acid--CoA ligase n=1 Tax=Streptomyces sp. NPDC004629 TaxID=3364705 RepID=UPI0036C9B81B